MSFTDEEKKRWVDEKRAREKGSLQGLSDQPRDSDDTAAFASCFHCGNPFRSSEGTVTSDAAICDVCNY